MSMNTGPEKGWDMRTLPVELAWKGGWGRHSHSFKPCQASEVGSVNKTEPLVTFCRSMWEH